MVLLFHIGTTELLIVAGALLLVLGGYSAGIPRLFGQALRRYRQARGMVDDAKRDVLRKVLDDDPGKE